MMKKALLLLFAIGAVLPLQAQLKGLLNKAKEEVLGGGALSEEEAGQGLKQALELGVGKAVDYLSAENGYLLSPYKILLPEEAQTVVSKLKMVPGFQDVEDQLIEKMNRAAELAAAKAKPIFVNAIKQMTFEDAMNILLGEKDAATRYLERSTHKQLYQEFLPVVQASLDEVNAREYWRSAVNAYNKIPLVRKTNPELDDHVTTKALEGMFSLIEEKERAIREDQNERTTELLRKVFARQD